MTKPPASPARGFTLLEVMVVVVIVGVLAAMVRLAVGDGGRAARLRDTAHLMQRLAAVAAQEAVFTSRPIALVFAPDRFELQELREGAWRQRTHDTLYRARPWPAGIEVRVAEPGRDSATAARVEAPAIFFPDGSAETLSIELRDRYGAGTAVLTPAADGYAVSFL